AGCARSAADPAPHDRARAPAVAAGAPSSSATAPVVSASAAGSASPVPRFTSAERVSLLVRGGDLLGGSGAPAAAPDAGVPGDRIVFVGEVDPAVQATTIVDARGKVVAPGFIDAHSHADPLVPNENVLAMGVTTVCIGQDGRSPSDGRFGAWADQIERGRPWV